MKKTDFTKLPLDKKIAKANKTIAKTLKKFSQGEIALAWTGGKDSTLILWLTRQVCQKNDFLMPRILFIDEGNVFDEVHKFVKKWAKEWGLKVNFVRNRDVYDQVNGKIGATVKVNKLSQRNQQELNRLGFKDEEFPFEPESFVGNHLMKTVAMNIWLGENKIEALITGIRWDEQEARANEKFFSPRKNPDHVRIHPILHFTEKDIWEATHKLNIPFVSLYKDGYRSLGARSTTEKAGDKPAWEQDMDKTEERAGRRQDKEKIMKRLRELGYM